MITSDHTENGGSTLATEPNAGDQLIARLSAQPREYSALQQALLTGLCDLVGATNGVAYLSRNDQQGSEVRSFISTRDGFGCGNDCHACVSRMTAGGSRGELVRSAVRYATPIPGGSVITRFGVTSEGVPDCMGSKIRGSPGDCGQPVAYIYSLFYDPKPLYVAIGAISLYRSNGSVQPFAREECNTVNEIHSKLAWLYDLGLESTNATESSASRPLQPRLLKVLEQLLAGYSEKQVAVRIGYSPHTIHTYVKAIYQHFGVSSRAELLAKVLGAR
jgi:DNA-binding CsgD family transcriptional regulator